MATTMCRHCLRNVRVVGPGCEFCGRTGVELAPSTVMTGLHCAPGVGCAEKVSKWGPSGEVERAELRELRRLEVLVRASAVRHEKAIYSSLAELDRIRAGKVVL
jgi:hypothetical protein